MFNATPGYHSSGNIGTGKPTSNQERDYKIVDVVVETGREPVPWAFFGKPPTALILGIEVNLDLQHAARPIPGGFRVYSPVEVREKIEIPAPFGPST